VGRKKRKTAYGGAEGRGEDGRSPRLEAFGVSPVFPGVPMAAKFLRMNNLDGPVQFIRRLRLFEPVAMG
jgi:hypothetical protein